MSTFDSEGIVQQPTDIPNLSVQVGAANRYVQNARARLDEAAGLLAIVDYVLRADASHAETAEALTDVFAQVELCTGNAAKEAQEICKQLPSDRDLRRIFN